MSLIGEVEEIKLDDRILYLVIDNYTSTYNVNFILGNQLLSVTGEIDRESMISIASEIIIQ